jgi:serine/threonine-protein kinase
LRVTDQLARLRTALANRYTIERELGAGGMATVYLAEDLKHDRRVAVKVLRPELAAALGPDRFPREIRILARLQHPHILPLLDSGEADGFLFYTMPYVEGESLRERIDREGALPVPEAVRILREVTDALASAHSAGVLHRDIKPGNVMLSGRHALVMDFGVAKAVTAAGGDTLTTVGVAVGTPTYMSPEQATASTDVDARSDIYALGILAYEMLTGHPPFAGRSAQATLSAQVLEKPRLITETRAAVSQPLGEFVMRCLEKTPADRWQTTEELVPLLEALATPSGGVTPTQTRPLKAVPPAPTDASPGATS